MMVMLAASFFAWWYGPGWRQVMVSFRPRLRGVLDLFSVTQLLQTLFAPWRRIITYPGRSLEERLHAAIDNLFSRIVGFVVRVVVLFTALVMLVAVAILTAAEVIVWPLLPLAVPGCLIAGLML